MAASGMADTHALVIAAVKNGQAFRPERQNIADQTSTNTNRPSTVSDSGRIGALVVAFLDLDWSSNANGG